MCYRTQSNATKPKITKERNKMKKPIKLITIYVLEMNEVSKQSYGGPTTYLKLVSYIIVTNIEQVY